MGEARLVNAMTGPGSRILDAGCGSGRTGGELARLGHEVIGVDVDPVLVAAAREDYPEVDWRVGDLAELALALPEVVAGTAKKFHAVVAAGNVIPFLAPSTRLPFLRALPQFLSPGARFVLGFGAGRGYDYDDFFADAARAGWSADVRFNGWDMHPFTARSDFLVTILSRSVPASDADSTTLQPLTLGKASTQGKFTS